MSADAGRHVPDLILEQYRLNELPYPETDRVERLLKTDQTLRTRLERLNQSDDDIASHYPPEWLVQRIRDRMAAGVRHSRSGRVRRLALVSALAVAVLLMVVPLLRQSPAPRTGGERVKGLAPSLAVYRRTSQGSEALADGAIARAGDLLRLGYVSAGRAYGVIVSIDGRGVVTRHLPPDGPRAASLRSGGTILLDDAYELDDAPAWERFFFVTADHAFDVAPIMEAARGAAARGPRVPPDVLPIPREFRQSTFSVQKEVRP